MRLKSYPMMFCLILTTLTLLFVGRAFARPKYKILHAFTGGNDGGSLLEACFSITIGNLSGTTRGGGTHNSSGTVLVGPLLERQLDGNRPAQLLLGSIQEWPLRGRSPAISSPVSDPAGGTVPATRQTRGQFR